MELNAPWYVKISDLKGGWGETARVGRLEFDIAK